MKKEKRKFWVLYHLGFIILSICVGMLMKYNQTDNALHPTVIFPIFAIFLMCTCIGYVVIFVINKAEKYSQSQVKKWIIPALLIFYVTVFLIANLSVTLAVFGWYIYTGTNLEGFWTNMFQRELSYANANLFWYFIFFTIVFFYILWQKSIKKEQKLIEENLRYRYNTLKSQVNPHFLFNSLNTLSELVYIDAKKSDNYIQTLSSIYRYVLENEETELVDLEKELEFVKQYFSLQQVRDEGKIDLEIELDQPEGIKVIPLSIQLLVENALKHNALSQEKPLKIKVFLNDNYIIVSNPIQRKSIMENSTQLGLSNLKDRVRIMFGIEIVISSENNNFIVQLPVQKQK